MKILQGAGQQPTPPTDRWLSHPQSQDQPALVFPRARTYYTVKVHKHTPAKGQGTHSCPSDPILSLGNSAYEEILLYLSNKSFLCAFPPFPWILVRATT